MFELRTGSVEETARLGEQLGRMAAPGDILCLYGNLGAGKTVLAQGVAKGLGVADQVTSPTFVLIREYRGRLPFYHFDAYRLEDAEEFAYLGYEEYFFGPGVVLIEWADRVEDFLPAGRLDIYVESDGENRRLFRFVPRGERYTALVEELQKHARPGN